MIFKYVQKTLFSYFRIIYRFVLIHEKLQSLPGISGDCGQSFTSNSIVVEEDCLIFFRMQTVHISLLNFATITDPVDMI